jgi:membrane protein implicated in regulation of membrane protease activity
MKPQTEPGLLGKLVALLVGAGLLVLGFMFSVVLLAIVAFIGSIAFAYFWWKTRALRKAVREQRQPESHTGDVIEGEAVVVEEATVRTVTVLHDHSRPEDAKGNDQPPGNK